MENNNFKNLEKKSSWEIAEDYLGSCKHGLHPSNRECWLGLKYDSNVHGEILIAMGLKGMKPRDVIYPIEHGYYKYLKTKEIRLAGLDDHVTRYKAKYEKIVGNGGGK